MGIIMQNVSGQPAPYTRLEASIPWIQSRSATHWTIPFG